MNRFFKNTIILLLLVFVGCKALGQKFATHAVKRGETLESIAKQYKVTPANILTFNKEIKAGQSLKPNTILVVPLDAASRSTTTSTPGNPRTPDTKDPKADQEEPIGYTSHKVRKRETLYGIAKRYKITEEDIKRYNRSLYSAQLKKKMVLKIPKYKRVKPSEAGTINEEDYETYTVAPKETRWSIAHKYGITIDSMLVLNPTLVKNSSYLAEGQELMMPKKAGSSVQNQVTELYRSYTVPKGVGIFRLTQELGVTSKEIMDLNPEIAEKGGLKEGMIIRIPQRKVATGDVNTDNYNFYEVKPKQTEFSLTRKLGISYKELLALNPDLADGLKVGMVLKLPKDQTGNFEVRNALVLDKINLLDSINVSNTPKVIFMFPFRLNKLDVSDRSGLMKTIKSRMSLQGSLGLYTGALIALDSIASLGISVDVKTFDNQYDVTRTKALLMRENLADVSAIIGPLDLPSLREVAVRASAYQVPVITPIPVAANLSMSNVFFSYTSKVLLQNRLLNFMKKHIDSVTNQNIIIIADSINVGVKDSILAKFPEAKVAVVIEEEKNIGINREKVAGLLSEDVENWVVVETDNYRLASSVTSILNSFHNSPLDPEISNKKISVRMFTTDNNEAFDNDVISNSHLSNLNFTYPSVYREVANNSFTRRYQKRFGDTPDRYAVRGFDITYDLLLKLAYKNNLIEASKLIGETSYTGNKFSYEKDFASGYFNQSSFIMMYEDMRIKEIKE